MIGALAQFGVLDPSNFLPDKCIFGTGIGCKEIYSSESDDQVTLTLVNNHGVNLRNVQIIPTGVEVIGCSASPTQNCVDGSTTYQLGAYN